MRVINKQDFDTLVGNDKYYKTRWSYMRQAAAIASEFIPGKILEIGAYTLPIVSGCDTMDVKRYKMATGEYQTYVHDASERWPIEDKAYDLVIALQVWEHIPDPVAAFMEMVRCSKAAVMSFPHMWDWPEDANHHMIDDEKISKWTIGMTPAESMLFKRNKRDKMMNLYVF